MRQPRILTEEENNRIVELYKAGMNSSKIAKELHCGVQIVLKAMNDLGLEARKRGAQIQDKPLNTKMANNHRLLYRFLEMYKMGDVYSLQDIADELHTTVDEVRYNAKILNLDRVHIDNTNIQNVRKQDYTVNSYSKINKDLTYKTKEENTILAQQILDNIYKYRSLRQRILNLNIDIIPNLPLIDKDGNVVTVFDIAIPKEHTLIVNTPTNDDKKAWRDSLKTNSVTVSNFIMSAGYYHIYYLNEGLDRIMNLMEEHAMNEESRRLSTKLKPNWENWDKVKGIFIQEKPVDQKEVNEAAAELRAMARKGSRLIEQAKEENPYQWDED